METQLHAHTCGSRSALLLISALALKISQVFVPQVLEHNASSAGVGFSPLRCKDSNKFLNTKGFLRKNRLKKKLDR